MAKPCMTLGHYMKKQIKAEKLMLYPNQHEMSQGILTDLENFDQTGSTVFSF